MTELERIDEKMKKLKAQRKQALEQERKEREKEYCVLGQQVASITGIGAEVDMDYLLLVLKEAFEKEQAESRCNE
ncbi:MAG: hypothetical protein RR678_10725 [Lachnospiraceae bacterium]